MKKAIVLGAGWAGLSCAVELADRGYSVTLLEQSKRLGGRASSFKDEKTGDVIDNGQHLLMGCYHHTLRFLEKIRALADLEFQDNLTVDFARPTGKLSTLSCGNWPAPFHLLSGLLSLDTLSFAEKLAVLKVHRAVKSPARSNGATVREELTRLGQSAQAQRYLWDPITFATLNESPLIAEWASLATVLREAFFSSRRDSQIAIAKVGLSELCGPGSEKFLKDRGGEIRSNHLVSRIDIRDGKVTGVQARDGHALAADVYVSALPFFALPNLLSSEILETGFFSNIRRLESSPIFSISLWFDRPITQKQFVGLLDTKVQWLFNKSRIIQSMKNRTDGFVSCVISGAREYLDTPNERLLEICLDDIHACFPQSRDAVLNHWLIQREKNATLSPKTGYEDHRLPQETPIPNFFLCGDWTQTGFPATLESAVASGVLAANAIEHRQRP